ncbi:MAG: GAF domain-containing sensor histidine kinase [Gemmatimonadetes bacterium]|nr:GAF domain-containing sensor histidine kinase [Gemmatimonadota bacterium]
MILRTAKLRPDRRASERPTQPAATDGWIDLVRTLRDEPIMPDVLWTLARTLVRDFGFARSAFALVDASGQTIRPIAGHDATLTGSSGDTRLFRYLRLPIEPGPTGRYSVPAWCVVQRRQAHVVRDGSRATRPEGTEPQPAILNALDVTEYVITPIRHDERVVALLAVDRKDQNAPLTAADCLLLENICALLSMRLGPTLERPGRAPSRAPEQPRATTSTSSAPDDAALAMLVHDLRAPMQGIVGHARLLQSGRVGTLDADQQSLVKRIVENGDYILELADRVLKAGSLRLDSLQPGDADAGTLVAEVIRRLEGKVLARDARITVDLVEPVPPLRADPFFLAEALQNLIDNALNAAPPGRTLSIRCAAVDDGFVRFDVRGEDALDVLRLRFEATPPPAGSPGPGRRLYHGTGLSIARRIVAAHGGRLWAELADDGRIAVAFTVPVSQAGPHGIPQV